MSQNISTVMFSGAVPMREGTADDLGVGSEWDFIYTGVPPATNTTWTFTITDDATATVFQVGAGYTTGISPTFCATYAGKVYLLSSSTVYFSASNRPTVFNDPIAGGNGYVDLSNQFQTPENLVASVPFQGYMAFFSRQTTQLWNTPADPLTWSLVQLLQNIGTMARLSVQPKGDLDVMFLSDTGVRSLRARETTRNAFVDDIGSPIDPIIQQYLALYPNDAANASAIVEPGSSRYWLFFKDTIFVHSFFPSSKVVGWSMYTPIDNAGISFIPSKFVVFKGQVWCRGGNKAYQYGGSNNNTYDNTAVTAELPWLDLKSPGQIKTGATINAAFNSPMKSIPGLTFTTSWMVSVGMDQKSGTLDTVWNSTKHTYDEGSAELTGRGSHFKARMVSSGYGPALFSSLVFHFQPGEEA